MCVILKKLNTCKISDLRPISLVTIIYKIISKVHSERLRVGREETILEVQGAAGKKIVDLVLIENEVVEENRSTGKEGVVFKIDFLKAYICVEWSFLDLLWIGRDLGQDGGSGFLVLVIGIIFGVDQWEAARQICRV